MDDFDITRPVIASRTFNAGPIRDVSPTMFQKNLSLKLLLKKRKNYIKQLIGRGVRLFREKRIHDGLSGFLRNQQEILHVICEKGGNFDGFVKEIRKELGLSRSSFQPELFVEQKTNKTIAKFEKFNEES